MKKIFILSVLCMIALTSVFAQATDDKQAEIKFEKTTYNFGTFPEKDGKVSCVFKFKNTGNASLIIHQAIASCGCKHWFPSKHIKYPNQHLMPWLPFAAVASKFL